MKCTAMRFGAIVVAVAFAVSGCSTSDDGGSAGSGTSRSSTSRSSSAGTRSGSGSGTRSGSGSGMRSGSGSGSGSGMRLASSGSAGTATLAIPTGDRSTSAILLEKTAPAEVRVGQTYEYVMKITNISKNTLENVTVNDDIKGAFSMSSSQPQARMAGGNASWNLGRMTPGQTKTIRVTGSATSTGNIVGCAGVEYNTQVCLETRVVQPKLALVKVAPKKLMTCDTGTFSYRVTNNGTGSARGVRISDALPAGWKTERGADDVNINVGTLGAGQSRSFDVKVKPAGRVAAAQSQATAVADGGLSARASATSTRVCQPALAITKKGPAKRYAGRSATYTITVRNTGDGPAKNCKVEDAIPSGASFVSATDGGTSSGGRVRWDLGTLAAGSSKTMSVTLKPGRMGLMRNTATARAYCAEAVTGTAETEVKGIPAVLLEVIDVEDPIEVGGQVTYVITVTNQGSATDTNIHIAIGLEAAHEFISARGATSIEGSGAARGGFSFKPLASLAPKEKAVWRVTVKAKSAADVRFRVTMNTDELKRPVSETEATRFYE